MSLSYLTACVGGDGDLKVQTRTLTSLIRNLLAQNRLNLFLALWSYIHVLLLIGVYVLCR